MGDLFNSGIRPTFDKWLLDKAAEERDYGSYWSASSAGYCMRRNIFERLKVPHIKDDPRKQRVFTVGHIFHEFMQRITKEAGLSIAQELELQDRSLMIRGHIDDLVLVLRGKSANISPDPVYPDDYVKKDFFTLEARPQVINILEDEVEQHLILYDYKSQSSRAFSYKRPNMSYYHKMQLGTYMYMLRKGRLYQDGESEWSQPLTEARILKISKDDLRMTEEQLLWSDELEQEVLTYWKALNKYWADKKIPPCTCADKEGGFLAKELYNPWFYDGEPCSIKWYEKNKKEGIAS